MEFKLEKTYFVYAILCQDIEGPGYIKFGFSSNIGTRLSAIRTQCPVPARYFCISEIGASKEKTEIVEKALHKRFKKRLVTGEWFRFDFSSKKDKEDFNQGCREVFACEIGKDYQWWTKVSIESIDKYNAERRRAFALSKHKKKIIAREMYRQRVMAARKELDDFSTW